MKKTLFLAAVLLCAPAFADWGGGNNTTSGGTHPTSDGSYVLYFPDAGRYTNAGEAFFKGHTLEVDGLQTSFLAAEKGAAGVWTGTLSLNLAGTENYALSVIQHPWRNESVGGFSNLLVDSMSVGSNFHFNVLANNTVTLNNVTGELNSLVQGHDGSINGTATLKTTKNTTFNSLTIGEGGNLNVVSGTTTVKSLSMVVGSAISVAKDATMYVDGTSDSSVSWGSVSGSGLYGYTFSGNSSVSLHDGGNVVRLYGVTGTLKSSDHQEINADVLLENRVEGNFLLAAANFSEIKGSEYVFNGAIRGTGNLALNQAGKQVTVTLNGDIAGWNSVDDEWSGLRGGDGCEVTANLNDAGVVQAAFNVYTLNIGADTQMMKRVNVTNLTVAENHTVSTHRYFGAQSISLADGASLTLDTSEASRTVGSLTLGDGASITLSHNDSHEGKALYTTGALTVEGNATMNADLVMTGGMLTFANGAVLTMGCGVTIGNDVTVVLTQDMVDSIAMGNYVKIFDSVDGLASLSNSITFIGADGVQLDQPKAYSLTQVGGEIYITPEPATATLSLLALAGLCARRKRH